MKAVLLVVVCIICFYKDYGQLNQQKQWRYFIKSSDSHLRNLTDNESAFATVDAVMQKVINSADQTFSIKELTTIVNICTRYCNTSSEISLSLSGLLRENHPIYNDKTPTEVNQFRSFLLASLSNLPPNEEIYKYVKSELQFGEHSINIAAAAKTAKNFPDKASELIPLMEPFLYSSFPDEWVDLTTPELNYPIANPTKARYEIISTLTAYGASAYPLIGLLDQIAKYNNSREYGYDSILNKKAEESARYIRKVTPLCCQKETTSGPKESNLILINAEDRKVFSAKDITIVDEDGDSLRFQDLTSKPFVLTFFYTQCTNAAKCVSTVHRLGELEAECIKSDMTGKMGIYGMTYDPDFDSPSILKKYGEMFGMKFSDNVKFLKTVSQSDMTFLNQLQLRVNYGAGTVNQHGIQLFVFDKKGRLAVISDNEMWSVKDVKNCLINLINE